MNTKRYEKVGNFEGLVVCKDCSKFRNTRVVILTSDLEDHDIWHNQGRVSALNKEAEMIRQELQKVEAELAAIEDQEKKSDG